jgi:hypothetical protein
MATATRKQLIAIIAVLRIIVRGETINKAIKSMNIEKYI